MITVERGIAAVLGTSDARGLAKAPRAAQAHRGVAMPRLTHLAPRDIGPSPWFSRNQRTPAAQEQTEVLLASVRHFGGNVQPIKVRPVGQHHANECEARFELVYGGRRLQACADLNLPVLALIEKLTDQQAFAQANAEQFQAPPLTFLERGTLYARAIDQGTFDSARELSAATGTPSWVVDRSLAVNTLTDVIDEMLPALSDVHEKLARKIVDVAQRFPDKIIALARSTDALDWLNVIQAARWIDPRDQPDTEAPRRRRQRNK